MTIKKTISVLGPNNVYLSHCTKERAQCLLESGRAIKINSTTVKLKQTKKERTAKKRNIIAESERICYICNEKIANEDKATIDHIIPKSRDRRADIYDNMRCCCCRCNNDKGNMMLSEYIEHIAANKSMYDYISDERLEYLKNFAKKFETDFYNKPTEIKASI